MNQRLHRLFKRGQDYYRKMKAAPPVLTSLQPDTVVSGSEDITLSCIGSGFTVETIIQFGTYDEPTTLVSPIEVTTIVKPSLFVPAVVPVLVHNGSIYTGSLNFTFTSSMNKN